MTTAFFMRFILYYIFFRWFIRITFSTVDDPVETVYVNIEGDIKGLVDAAKEGVDKTKDTLGELDDAGQKAGASISKGGVLAGAAFGLAAGAAAKLLDVVVNLAVAIPQAFAALGREAVQANAEFETFATQFETLLGSGALAKERLDELAQFGVETPFELPEVVEASRTLQVFGGTALATGENLRMIGDIAAGVNQPFQDVAFWIGRMYDAMQNGQPFGEASARLQEMGALSGDTRRKLEDMQKTGEDGAKIFAVFSEEVGGKFSGNMERLSKTFQGVTSNLADFRGNLLRVGGEPLFEEIRQSAIDFLDLLDQNEGTITNIAKGMGEMAASVVRFAREGLGQVDFASKLKGLQSFVEWLNQLVRGTIAAGEQLGKFVASLDFIGTLIVNVLKVAFAPLLNALGQGGDLFSRLDEAMITAAKGLAIITATIEGLKVTVMGAWESLKGLGNILLAIATRDIDALKEAMLQFNDGVAQATGEAAKAFKESMLDSAASIDAMINPTEEATEKVEELGKAMADTANQAEQKPLVDPGKMEQFSNQLIEATERRTEAQEQLEADHAKKVSEIIEDGNQEAMDIEERYNDDREKLAQETEKKRLEIIDDTRKQLNELSKETDRDIAKRRKDFNQDERRETEDHLKEMRRMQEDHLLDLEDAVRDRDAGAIVDLQRRFQTEASRKEEDFSENISRDRQDFSKELSQLRENEAQRREELLANQAEQLDDLRQHEEEKRLEIETRRIEENEKLQQNLQDRLQRENDSYMQRQAALDEALQNQLAAIAQNLADEKEVTEEGARAILETFDEYFGIGGNIDELMANFSRRRKIRADITVAFQSSGVLPSEEEQKTTSVTEALKSGGSFGGRKRLGGIQEFAEGGTLLASKPTLALFGEKGPEIAQFTPMSQLSAAGEGAPGRMVIEMTGSAPPGIGSSERDQIASVLLTALRDTGVLGE